LRGGNRGKALFSPLLMIRYVFSFLHVSGSPETGLGKKFDLMDSWRMLPH
jgi:hypothetical protein